MYWLFFPSCYLLIAYSLLCLLNPSGGVLAVGLLTVLVYCVLFVLKRKTGLARKVAGNVYKNITLVCLSVLVPIFLMDLFFVGKAVIFKSAHDIPVIPYLEQVTNADGYHAFVQQPNYKAEGIYPGQAGSQPGWSEAKCLKPRLQRVVTDENGLRNGQEAHNSPIDILLMGDSFAFGYGTNQPDIWSELLVKRNIGNVYNMGVYGASPGEQVELLRYLIEGKKITMRRNADVFFIIFQGNDLTDKTPYNYENEKTKIDYLVGYMRYIQTHTLIYKLYNFKKFLDAKHSGYTLAESNSLPPAAFLYSAGRYSENETDDFFKEKQHEKAFSRLKDQVTEFCGKVFVLYCPTKAHAYAGFYNLPEQLTGKFHDFYRDLTRKACEERGFTFIDLQPILEKHAAQGEILYWTDDTHLNIKGHEVLADIVQDSIKPGN